jgi:mannose-6-phosphate isomerase class I
LVVGLLSVIAEEGDNTLNKGTHPIIPVGLGEFSIEGDCQFIVSHK